MAAIRDLMVTQLISIAPGAPVQQAASLMLENKVGAVIVVEGGKLQGILSERDLVTRVLAAGKPFDSIRSGAVATSPVVTVDVDAPFRSVLETFRSSRFRHLPVLEDGVPVGILSTRDFLAYLVDGLEHLIDDATYREQLASGVDPYDHIGGSYDK